MSARHRTWPFFWGISTSGWQGCVEFCSEDTKSPEGIIRARLWLLVCGLCKKITFTFDMWTKGSFTLASSQMEPINYHWIVWQFICSIRDDFQFLAAHFSHISKVVKVISLHSPHKSKQPVWIGLQDTYHWKRHPGAGPSCAQWSWWSWWRWRRPASSGGALRCYGAGTGCPLCPSPCTRAALPPAPWTGSETMKLPMRLFYCRSWSICVSETWGRFPQNLRRGC